MTNPEEISTFLTWLKDQGYEIEDVSGDSESRGAPVPGEKRTYTVTFSVFDKADLPEMVKDE